MKRTPSKFILKIKPGEYLKQGLSHCGAYAIKGILSAYGKDKRTVPQEYHPNWFGRLTGLTLGRNYWPNVLRAHGVKAEPKSAKNIPENKRLNILNRLVSSGNPVMVAVGNGYLPNGKYNAFLGKFIAGHWVTIWGYDDKKREFYVYDSAVPKNLYDKDIPVGNVRRSYREMLRDWYGAWSAKIFKGFSAYEYIEIQ